MSDAIRKMVDEGRKAHEQKQYEKSIDAFNRAHREFKAIPGSPSELLLILDLRIASLVKLGKLDLAREDAKSMVRASRSDGRGYLRCGQLERVEENYDAALKWYDHGLKNVTSGDRLYGYITIQKAKTADLRLKLLRSSKARDPMAILPLEILQMIVQYLEFRQVVGVLRVSKSWTRALKGLLPLRDTLDFSNARKTINYHMMNAALRRLSKWPKSITLTNMNDAAANLMREHLERWINYKALEHLSISSKVVRLHQLPFHRYGLRTISIGWDGSLPFETICNVIQHCPLLQSAEFGNILPLRRSHLFPWAADVSFPNLQLLRVEGSQLQPGLSLLADDFKHFPNLLSIVLRDVTITPSGESNVFDLSSLTQLKTFTTERGSLPSPVILPEAIEELNVVSCGISTDWTLAPGQPSMHPLPNLRSFKMDNCDLCPGFLANTCFRPGKSNLRVLSLTGWVDLSRELFLALKDSESLARLASLRLTSGLLVDGHLGLFLEKLPLLKELTLEHARITGVFLVGLLTSPTCQLLRIALRGCHNVSADAIAWARDRGISVDVNNELKARGDTGRRVRDW